MVVSNRYRLSSMTASPRPAFIPGLSAIAADYDAIICDVWGVIHNGTQANVASVEALRRFRSQTNRPVILLTNAPRPSGPIFTQLDGLNVPRDAYDDIVTSGDATVNHLKSAAVNRYIHIGPKRDLALFEGLDGSFSDDADGEIIVCTGLHDDEREEPEDYCVRFEELAGRGLKMVCANPDLVVERGGKLVHCAGALARLYTEIGGQAQIIGKPYAPVYDLTRQRLTALSGSSIPSDRILAIGDGLPTDIQGAVNQDLGVLFVTAGIHAADFGAADSPQPDKVEARLDADGLHADAVMPRLVW